DAVAVHVSRAAHGPARVVTRVDTGEDEAPAAVAAAVGEQARERNDRGEALRRAEHDVALARARASTRVGKGRADDQVADSVAVDVPRRADRGARYVDRIDPREHEAATPVAAARGIQARERNSGRKALSGTEHDVAVPHEEVRTRAGP